MKFKARRRGKKMPDARYVLLSADGNYAGTESNTENPRRGRADGQKSLRICSRSASLINSLDLNGGPRRRALSLV